MKTPRSWCRMKVWTAGLLTYMGAAHAPQVNSGLSKSGCNAAVASVDLAFTNSSPFTPIHSGLYANTALLINPTDSFTVFNPFSLC